MITTAQATRKYGVPSKNPNYDPKTEVRKVPYVDLYKAYKEGKNIVELAN
jgi:hypothetical protein